MKGRRDTSRMRWAESRESYADDAGFWIRAILGYVQRAQLEGNCLTSRRLQRRRFDDDITGLSTTGTRVGAWRGLWPLPRCGGLGHYLRKNKNHGRNKNYCSSRFHLSIPLSAAILLVSGVARTTSFKALNSLRISARNNALARWKVSCASFGHAAFRCNYC